MQYEEITLGFKVELNHLLVEGVEYPSYEETFEI